MEAPRCPKCGRKMVLRTARQGRYAGKQFWGCSGYPNCRGIVNIRSEAKSYVQPETHSFTSYEEPEQSTGRKIWLSIRLVLGSAIAIAGVIAGIWFTINEYSGYHPGRGWGGGMVILIGLAIGAAIVGNETIQRKRRR